MRRRSSRTSSSARDQAAPLPTITSGRSALCSIASARSTAPGSACARAGSGARSRQPTLASSRLPDDHVVGQVEVHRAGSAGERRAHRLLDVVRQALDRVRPRRVLHERPRGLDLRALLERAHPVLEGVVRAAEQQHRPAVRLRVGEARDRVDHARPRHRQARARPARQVAVRARGVAGRLLVAEAVVRARRRAARRSPPARRGSRRSPNRAPTPWSFKAFAMICAPESSAIVATPSPARSRRPSFKRPNSVSDSPRSARSTSPVCCAQPGRRAQRHLARREPQRVARGGRPGRAPRARAPPRSRARAGADRRTGRASRSPRRTARPPTPGCASPRAWCAPRVHFAISS